MSKDYSFYLYRHYDKDDNLLYVGVSWSVIERLRRHEKSSHWFGEVDIIKLEKYPSREASLEAERKAILAERPRYNKAHTKPSRLSELRKITREIYDRQMEKEYQIWLKEQEERRLNKEWRDEFRDNYNRDFPSDDGEYHVVII
jgi:predicted GIY-YIG superfamily endonuclease